MPPAHYPGGAMLPATRTRRTPRHRPWLPDGLHGRNRLYLLDLSDMNLRKFLFPFGFLLVCTGTAVTGLYLRADRLAHIPRSKTSAAAQGMEKPPPLLSFATTALGGFRGIIADALWLRAGRMQEQRRFVELVQLSDWITALEPDNDDVWTFHAWNLAYNIPVLLSRPEDRWNWVSNGISLLRDRGIPINPSSAALKRELGWIFQHKIGLDSDPASPYYRLQWARQIAPSLLPDGSAPAPFSPQAARLAESARMDASVLRLFEQRFGSPIDWRSPFAQSLYWSALALENNPPARETLPCRRMAYTSLIALCFRGTLPPGDPNEPDWHFSPTPNPRLIPATQSYLEETLRLFPFAGIRYAYVGFLCDAILLYLQKNDTRTASLYHQKLQTFFRELGAEEQAIPPLDRFPETPPETYTALLQSLGIQ